MTELDTKSASINSVCELLIIQYRSNTLTAFITPIHTTSASIYSEILCELLIMHFISGAIHRLHLSLKYTSSTCELWIM